MKSAAQAVALLSLLSSGAARAEAEPAGEAGVPAPAPSTPASGTNVPDGLNFDLFNEGKKPTLAEVEKAKKAALLDHQVKLRRNLLTAHQAFGFATLGVLTATLVVGTLNYVDKFDGDYTGKYNTAHLGLGITSAALFATTGMLALLAPNPYPKPIKFDAALLHKVSMALAAAGMLTELILGPISVGSEGTLSQRPLAAAHLGVGYATWAFMATGTLAYVF